jgi:hypothetical protein
MPVDFRQEDRNAALLALQLLVRKAEHNSIEKLAEWQADCGVAFRFTLKSLENSGLSRSSIAEWRTGFKEFAGFLPEPN